MCMAGGRYTNRLLREPIVPAMTMRDVIGPDSLLVMRASDRRCRWLLQDPMIRDSLPAPTLSILGGTPSSAASSASRRACAG
jgi:hypothetical protein